MRLRRAAPREKDIQWRVAKLYASCGCRVYSTSQYRPSMQALGLPDLYVVHPRAGAWWHEVKRPGGKQSPTQLEFQRTVEAAGVVYVLGGIDEAYAVLAKRGVLQDGFIADVTGGT